MKQTYYYVISMVSAGEMKLYKGQEQLEQKPVDIFRGDKNFSFDVEYFTNKKDRDRFYDSNNMNEGLSKGIFKKTQYYVISLAFDGKMKLYKGQEQSAQKPDDMFRGDKNLSFDIEYFANKRERDRFYDCNVIKEQQEIIFADEKANLLADFFAAQKMDDCFVSETYPDLVVKDDEGNCWKNAEIYDFVLNECLAFDENGELSDGLAAAEPYVDTLKEHALTYGVKPITAKRSIEAQIAAAEGLKEVNKQEGGKDLDKNVER